MLIESLHPLCNSRGSNVSFYQYAIQKKKSKNTQIHMRRIVCQVCPSYVAVAAPRPPWLHVDDVG